VTENARCFAEFILSLAEGLSMTFKRLSPIATEDLREINQKRRQP